MMSLIKKINDKSAKVLVVGGGYVGLPLAIRCAEEGFETTVYDIDKSKIENINKGISYIGDVSSDVLLSFVQPKKLRGIQFLEELTPIGELDPEKPDVILICVPTPLNKRREPDISFIVDAAKTLSSNSILQDEQIVILESTVYPGFTKEMLLDILYDMDDPYVAFSPERVDPGNKNFGIKNTPKVVGGVGDKATDIAVAFYKQIVDDVVRVSSAETAEMTKIYENTFRMINIGLANETAIICNKLGIDVWEMIEAAGTKPYGFMKFTPGPGIGGHCISVDPHYLSWKLKDLGCHSKFIDLAEEINVAMPKEIVKMTVDALNSIEKSVKGSSILVLGVAYKPDIDDVRESPALDIIEMLKKKGAYVRYYDPNVPKIWFPDGNLYGEKDLLCLGYDCAVIVTNHSVFDYTEILRCAKTFVDSRGVLEPSTNVFKL
jgi:UDP-N-acetyl-D-glucosamine dehydrogenase